MNLNDNQNRETKEPVAESLVIAITALCAEHGVMVGRTNRSFREYNNTIELSPAFICTQRDIDQIVAALDCALAQLA